jgi:L-ascorbate metabolism protein UlaG (beta-lactamase superfamily)
VLEYGQEVEEHGFRIKALKSIHGDLPNGRPKPEVIGFLINNKIYNPGDTINIPDKPKAEIVFPPICGTVVMDPKEAADFTQEVEAKIAVPVHYDNPDYPVDVEDFSKALSGEDIQVKILDSGQSIEI